MTKLETAVESVAAKALTRFVAPGLLAILVSISAWYGHRAEGFFAQVVVESKENDQQNMRLQSVEAILVDRSKIIGQFYDDKQDNAARFATLETQMKHVNDTLLRIESLIKRPIEERQ